MTTTIERLCAVCLAPADECDGRTCQPPTGATAAARIANATGQPTARQREIAADLTERQIRLVAEAADCAVTGMTICPELRDEASEAVRAFARVAKIDLEEDIVAPSDDELSDAVALHPKLEALGRAIGEQYVYDAIIMGDVSWDRASYTPILSTWSALAHSLSLIDRPVFTDAEAQIFVAAYRSVLRERYMHEAEDYREEGDVAAAEADFERWATEEPRPSRQRVDDALRWMMTRG